MLEPLLAHAALDRLRDAMSGYVNRGEIPGIVTLLARDGEVVAGAFGARTMGGEPIGRDAIFRITSMSRPVAGTAAMILVDDGVLALDDPVDALLPELANRRVLRHPDATLDDTVPARRPITLRDLLTFRPGLGMALRAPTSPFEKRVAELGLVGFGPPDPASPLTHDEWMTRLGTLPLLHQPGERWMYNTSSSITGVLVARASGKSLEDFYRERIFGPLGMGDTGFTVPSSKLGRFTGTYHRNGATGALELADPATAESAWARRPAFEDAGAGLVSTADDYCQFARMLLGIGDANGVRILSRSAVEQMTVNQITPEQKKISPFFPEFWVDRGWGFGMSIVTRRTESGREEPVRFGWDGGYGTSAYADPNTGLVGIFLSQLMQDAAAAQAALDDFWRTAYEAVEIH